MPLLGPEGVLSMSESVIPEQREECPTGTAEYVSDQEGTEFPTGIPEETSEKGERVLPGLGRRRQIMGAVLPELWRGSQITEGVSYRDSRGDIRSTGRAPPRG